MLISIKAWLVATKASIAAHVQRFWASVAGVAKISTLVFVAVGFLPGWHLGFTEGARGPRADLATNQNRLAALDQKLEAAAATIAKQAGEIKQLRDQPKAAPEVAPAAPAVTAPRPRRPAAPKPLPAKSGGFWPW